MAVLVTRTDKDPLRNFKFQVQLLVGGDLQNKLLKMAFTNVAGLSMNTEMVPYREGGWNTNFHKLPGQTDFGPLTLTQGVVPTRDGMWELAKQMFAVQWGTGSLKMDTDFRYTTVIRVLDHPVTYKEGSGTGGSPSAARLAFVLNNCWTGSVAFNDLDASGNQVLVSQLTMHHEGFEVFWDSNAVELKDPAPV